MDTSIYFWALLLAAALFALVYCIRKYLELANSYPGKEEDDGAAGMNDSACPAEAVEDPDASGRESAPSALAAEQAGPETAASAPEPAAPSSREQPSAAPAEPAASPAENFVRGIYTGISGLDARLKEIEVSLSKGRSNNEFAVKFLEDIAADIDSLDKAKIKARLEYLLSDLKK